MVGHVCGECKFFIAKRARSLFGQCIYNGKNVESTNSACHHFPTTTSKSTSPDNQEVPWEGKDWKRQTPQLSEDHVQTEYWCAKCRDWREMLTARDVDGTTFYKCRKCQHIYYEHPRSYPHV